MFKLLSGLVGGIGVLANKEKTFLTFAKQFLKDTPQCNQILSPYLDDLVSTVFTHSKEKDLQLSDEVDLLESILRKCIYFINQDEYMNLPTNLSIDNNPKIQLSMLIAMDFLQKHSIKY